MALLQLLRKYQGDAEVDKLREGLRFLVEALMDLEVTERIGAARYERTPTRQTQRNGYRLRPWDTRVGTVPLRIPKLRQGSYFPRLGLEGISKSEVSRICAELDAEMARFRDRPLEGRYPYVWLDAKAVKAREDGRVVNQAAVVAVGVRETGQREVLGFDVGAAETYEFWLEFLRSLVRRGLQGVRLVISDAHEGLKRAIAEVLAGASRQRSRVHLVRNLLAAVPRHAHDEVVALLHTIWLQPNQEAATAQLHKVADPLALRFPKAAQKLRDACDDVLAYMAFPRAHWRRLHSTNVLERLNRELGRRFDVVGIFPNTAAVLRLLGAVLAEQHDEWAAARNYFSAASMALLDQQDRQQSGETAAFADIAAD